MKIQFFVVLIFLSLKSFAQYPANVHTACNFLKNLHFTNGADTIILKVNYHALYSQGAGLILKDLESKKKLNAEIFKNAIAFEITSCSRRYMGAYHVKNKTEMAMLEKLPEGTTVYLTCIVYEGYYNYGEPFFIIGKLEMTAPSKR